MRKLLFSLSLLTATLLNAQLDPLSQFFNKSFIPNLVEYDSITVSLDTGANFSTAATAAQHYFTNGNIDTLVIEEMGVPVYGYNGNLSGRTTTIIGKEISSNNTVDKLVFNQDSLYRDSTVAYYEYNGFSFQLFFEAAVHYTSSTSNSVDHIDIYADLGTGLTRIGSYNYFYGGGGYIDSIFYTVSLGGSGDGFFKYRYSSSNPSQLMALEAYEDIDNDGERDLIQRLAFKHNMLLQVTQITEYGLDNNNNLVLYGEYRYNKRKNSTINLPEVENLSISLYPNPAHSYLKIDFDEDTYSSFSIHSISGQEIFSGKLQSTLDISSLPKAYYILSLSGSKESVQIQFKKM